MTPRIGVYSANELSAQQQDEIDAWFHMQFGHIPYEWAAPAWHVLACVDDTLVSCLRLLQRVVSAGDQPVRVGGVGGIMTRPQWQRRGLASATLRRAAELIADELRAEIGFLLCREEVAPVYARLGWQTVPGPTTFAQSTGMTTYPRLTMVLPCTTRTWPGGAIDMRGLPW